MATEQNTPDQASLFAELEKTDVKISKEQAAKVKENLDKVSTGLPWLGVGVHEVLIQKIELAKAGTGTLGLKFSVENEEGQGEVTMWLSEAALPYTIENVSRLVVHNTPVDKKADARDYMGKIVSAKDLVKVAQEKLVDGQAWLSIKESATETYTNKTTGEIKPSLDRNLLAYEPKATKEQLVSKAVEGSEKVTDIDPSEIPF